LTKSGGKIGDSVGVALFKRFHDIKKEQSTPLMRFGGMLCRLILGMRVQFQQESAGIAFGRAMRLDLPMD
jgi:hypothetical protein